MKLVRIGRRWINIEYLILGEENDGSPETVSIPTSGVRVTLEAGKEFDLDNGDADKFRRYLEDCCLPDPAENLVAHDDGPEEEESPGRKRKKKG